MKITSSTIILDFLHVMYKMDIVDPNPWSHNPPMPPYGRLRQIHGERVGEPYSEVVTNIRLIIMRLKQRIKNAINRY